MGDIKSNLNPKVYAKAIMAGISAAASVIATAVPEDSTVGIIAAVIIAACGTIATWFVPNKKVKKESE